MKNLSIQYKKTIIEYFYKNIQDKDILEKTIKSLNLDNNSDYGKSRIQFLIDFQDYVLKNGKNDKVQYIYPSIAYNM